LVSSLRVRSILLGRHRFFLVFACELTLLFPMVPSSRFPRTNEHCLSLPYLGLPLPRAFFPRNPFDFFLPPELFSSPPPDHRSSAFWTANLFRIILAPHSARKLFSPMIVPPLVPPSDFSFPFSSRSSSRPPPPLFTYQACFTLLITLSCP